MAWPVCCSNQSNWTAAETSTTVLTEASWCRERAAQLTAKLKGCDEEGARQMLEAEPRLMHTKDPHTGLPPLHTATKMVRGQAQACPVLLGSMACGVVPEVVSLH